MPKLLAQGFGAKVGDTVVVVATNKDGSVNGKTFLVSGILESATGPGGATATSISKTPEKSCGYPAKK